MKSASSTWFYYKALFKCSECSASTERVIRMTFRSKHDALQKLGEVHCLHCSTQVEFLEMYELTLQHLENFIVWAGGD